jgi:hypothetical protein
MLGKKTAALLVVHLVLQLVVLWAPGLVTLMDNKMAETTAALKETWLVENSAEQKAKNWGKQMA